MPISEWAQRSAVFRYGIAAAAIALAAVARWAGDPLLGSRNPYATFFIAVLLLAWLLGIGPAIAGLLVSSVLASWFVPPHGAFGFKGPEHALGLGVYVAVCLTGVLIIMAERAASRRAAENARLAKERMEQLRRQQLWSEVTLASIGDAVISTDTSGRINFMNAVAESLTGWTNPEASGRPLNEIFRIVNQETGAVVENPADRVLREGVTVGLANHTALVRRDGSVVPIDDAASPIRGTALQGAVLIFRDITARRKADRALRESEQKLRLVTDLIPQQVWTCQPDGAIDYSNPRWLEYAGLSPEQTRGHHWSALVHPEDRDRVLESWRAAAREGSPYELETRLRRRDGEYRWFLVRGLPLRDETGAVVRWYGANTDIEDRKRAEAALRASETRFRELADAAPVLIWGSGLDKRYNYFNKPWLEFTGRSLEQELGDRWAEGVHPDDVARCLDTYTAGFDARRPFSLEYRLRRHDGEYRWILDTGVPRFDSEGRFLGYLGSCIDITGRKRAEDDLRRARDQAANILESITDWFFAVDRDWRFTYVNGRLAGVTGMPREAFLGKTLWDVFPEAARTGFYENYTRAMNERIPIEFEVDYASTGQWFGVRAYPTDEGLSAYISDITESKKAREIRAFLAAIVESSSDAIIGKTSEGIIQTWNAGAETIYGYSAEEVVGRPITILLPPDRAHEESGIIESLRSGGRIENFETVRLRKDGRQIQVSLTISPVLDAAGRLVGASHVARDITERNRMEDEFRQRQRLESLGVLAGGVAHDFNNLLVGILGNSSLAADMLPRNHPARPMIEEAAKAGERAADLTRQLLAYSGRGTFLVRSVDLSEVVRDTVGLVRSSLAAGVDLRLDLAPSIPAVEADVTQIRQVVMNLVINAAEAIGDYAGTVTVKTSERFVPAGVPPSDGDLRGGLCVALEVSDTGCGMDDATKARIFDPFFTTKFTGRGLGLSAVLGIVRGHHGAVRLESAPGRGTTFTVLLPAAGAEAEPLETVEARGDYHGHETVLVVDDEETVRRAARFTLERYGYSVLVAEGGDQALDILSRRDTVVTLIVLDLTMPRMNGEEVLRRIRVMRGDIPVILSSGFSESEALRRFEGLNLAGFLQKPYTSAKLAAKVKAASGAAPSRGAA